MARERQFVTGENIDAKFTRINKVLNRLAQRTANVIATVYMPQIPIMGSVSSPDKDGLLFRFVLPLAGYIRKAYMYVDSVAAKIKPKLTMNMQYQGSAQSETLVYIQGANTLTKSVPVPAGAILTLSTTEPESVSGISIGLVFEVGVESLVKEQVALAAHLESVEEEDAGETEG